MPKHNFTTSSIASFKCPAGKAVVFYRDALTPGLGLRVTASGAKTFIFETYLNGKSLRITIGDVATWLIPAARAQATAYKVQTDQGIDPRKVKADALAAQQQELVAEQAARVRGSITFGDVWPEYMADRIASREGGWSKHHIRAHKQAVQLGGEKRTRSPKLTQPGPLAPLVSVRLIDLDQERIEAWAKSEAKIRPSSARMAWRLLKAFLNWCRTHKEYSAIVVDNPAGSARVRESLGKAKVRNDVLQREQLAPWFAAVMQIGNPVIAAYLQCLLLIGARREELAALRWEDVNFQWNSIKLSDKVEDFRLVPLTPYVAHLLAELKRQNDTPPNVRAVQRLANRGQEWRPSDWVFSSPTSESGHIAEPRIAHNEALAVAGLPPLTLHGLRRSFASLCEWTETPAGIAAQIQGHAPQGVREQNYIRRPLDLLRMWHIKFETWLLEQAHIDPPQVKIGLRLLEQS